MTRPRKAHSLWAVALLAALALGACGGGGKASSPDSASDQSSPITPATAGLPSRTTPRPVTAFRGPDRVNYLNARKFCRRFDARSLGQDYEAEGPGRVNAAKAYAANNFSPQQRPAAYEGCLAGLRLR
jgi:hypothetical protein